VQELLGLRLQLGAAARSAARGEPAPGFVPALTDVAEGIADVVRQLRGLITELRPTGLEERGLPRALENYVAGLHLTGGAPEVALDVDLNLERLAPEVALCLFRVAQEAVRNALAHAQSRRVVVRARLRSPAVILRVGDDGCGFEVPERLGALAAEGHFGLVGMTERVASAGGRLRVRSRPGKGTTVTVWMPVREGERWERNNGNPSPGG
jgi:signal transduction histidine kinase